MLYEQEDKLEYFKHGMRQFSNSTELLVTPGRKKTRIHLRASVKKNLANHKIRDTGSTFMLTLMV